MHADRVEYDQAIREAGNTKRNIKSEYVGHGEILEEYESVRTEFNQIVEDLKILKERYGNRLDDLNNRMEDALSMDRFRPGIVMTGGQAFEEDAMEQFSINEINFYGVKLCARCIVTTTNQETGITGKEPLKTLAKYRMANKKVYFGQNVLCGGEGLIKLGDEIKVIRRKQILL